jgi:PAS domain-containing protein
MSEQHPVEIIMARGLMSNMTTAAFLVDNGGTLIFFNDAAGELLGVRYEEARPMPAEEWGTQRIVSATGQAREIEASAFPIVGRGGQTGAIAIFWDRSGYAGTDLRRARLGAEPGRGHDPLRRQHLVRAFACRQPAPGQTGSK